jgi:uncharacterized protein
VRRLDRRHIDLPVIVVERPYPAAPEERSQGQFFFCATVRAINTYKRIAFSVAAVLLAAAAAHAQPVRSLLEFRHEGVVVQQWDSSCGAAALATVLTYTFDDAVREKTVAQSMLRRTDPLRVRVRGGFSLLDMKRYAESRGYAAEGYGNTTLEELAAMRSPIVPIVEYGSPHFVVVRRVHDREVDIADPAFGNRRLPLERFRQAWQNGIAFVLERKGR